MTCIEAHFTFISLIYSFTYSLTHSLTRWIARCRNKERSLKMNAATIRQIEKERSQYQEILQALQDDDTSNTKEMMQLFKSYDTL